MAVVVGRRLLNVIASRRLHQAGTIGAEALAGAAMLKVKDVAERLGVSAQTVYTLCARGRLTHIRVGVGRGTIRVSEESLAAYIRTASGTPGPGSVPSRPTRLRHLRA